MAKYTADIEIAVRGGQQVDGLIKGLNRLNNSINVVTRNAKLLEGKGFNVASMENYSRAVFKAENAIRKAAQGTRQEEQAVKALVTAIDAENKARARRNFLIAQEVANRRQVIATANAGVGLQGPQAAPIRAGRGPASPIRGTANMPGSPAALAVSRAGAGAGAFAKRIPGAISGGIIGGSFPLLFGQGGGAAAGGAIGGLVGGLAGPGGSFAGSLLGTLIGDVASQGQKIKQLGADIGFSAEQANVLADGFKKANVDIEKFTGVVQNIRGLGLELKDQAELIKLTTALTTNYGGQFDKVGNAITSALESGKVNQSILNQLTSQGINIQQALADKFGVSRDRLLEMAKKGEISVQDLTNTLVELGNKGVKATADTKSGFDRLKDSFGAIGSELMALGGLIVSALKGPFDWLLGVIADVIQASANGISIIKDLLNVGSPNKLKAIAAVQQGRLPTGTAGVEELIGKGRMRQLQKEAGPGFLGLGFNESKFIKLLQAQPEFALPKATPIKPIDVRGLGQTAPSGTGAGSNKAEKAAAREAARVLEVLRDQRLITIELNRQSDYSKKIFAAELAKDPILARRLQGEQQLEEIAIETAGKLEKEVNMQAKLAILGAQEAKAALAYQETAQAIALLEQQRRENAENTIRGFQQELDLKNATTEAERNRLQIMYEMDALRRGGGYNETELQQIEALKKQIAAPETAGEIIQKRIGALQDEITKLTNLGTIAVSVADSIGAAFGQAFQGIISGTMTTQEALASFFQSIGDAFIQMATEIIAKQITMIILQTILKALGGGGANAMPFAGGPATGGTTNVGAYAAGAPTFFKPMADGGSVKAATPYLVGERGPELFVPGTNGGIMSNSDLRSSMGAAPGSPAGAPVLNMSFETSTINGVEYVSRDQLEAAMAETRRQATRDGAKRGMTMTLDRIQQSPQTRNRIGLR